MTVAPSPPSTPRIGRRLAPMPFTLAVLAVYAASFVSQMLLSPPTTGPLGVFPFALVQVALIGVWIVLHRRRLHDAGRPGGLVIGIAAVYAIEVVLLTIVVGLIVASTASTTDSAGSESSILHLFLIIYLFTLLTGDASLGALQFWITGFAVVLLLPVVIAVIFSIWTATRPSVAP